MASDVNVTGSKYMKKSVRSIGWMIATVILAMGASGCATRRYVRNQVKPVDQRVSDLEQKTNEQISAVSSKEQADVSRLDERITSTDSRVVEVASVAQQASIAAGQANQLGQANRSEIQSHNQRIDTLDRAAQNYQKNAWNYQLIDKADVTFKLNKSRLDKQSQAVLDMMAQKAKSTPGAVINLEGFADKSGGDAHNLTLSRNRADAVARYLVQQNVPLRDINRIGLGEEIPSSTLASDFPNPGATPTRRVYIRVYAPTGEASRAQP